MMTKLVKANDKMTLTTLINALDEMMILIKKLDVIKKIMEIGLSFTVLSHLNTTIRKHF